jgi:exopolysaccharide biosynthesis polyprenyl glycosylphosphotransferase
MTVTTHRLAAVAELPVPRVAAPTAPTAPAVVRRRDRRMLLLGSDLGAGALAALVVALVAPAYDARAVAVVPLVWLAALLVAGAYRAAIGSPPTRPRAVLVAGAVLTLAGWAVVATAPQAAAVAPGPLARSTVLLAVLATVATVTLRVAVVRLARPATPTVVVCGPPAEVEALLAELERPGSAFRPVALCLPHGSAELLPTDLDLPLWYGTGELARLAVAFDADAVITTASTDHATLRALGHQLHDAGVALLAATSLRDVESTRIGHTTAGTVRLLELRPAPLSGPARVLKDVVDRLGAALLLVVTAPALLAIAAAVRRDSAGPAIYRQERVGLGGRPFTVYKFRTMSADADQRRGELVVDNESDRSGVLFKIRADPRITRVGAVLRRYSLDELPQLLNVVRGEMSLIGPRPALPAEVAAYPEVVARRLVVKPGMTGLWQVSGRSDLDWDETVRLDLAYVENWSWRADLAIAARTVGAVLGHRGAY